MNGHLLKTLKPFILSSLVLATTLQAQADTTIDSQHAHAYGANTGFINWRPDMPTDPEGAVIGLYICSGWIYSGNVGWIHLGNGLPSDSVRYANASATDYGVNHDGAGALSGYAYGANIGWIHFEQSMGQPAIDLTTGRFSGYAWGANVGWIDLGQSSIYVRTERFSDADSDSDGIADAWEYETAREAGVSASLGTMDVDSDQDGDGTLDLVERSFDTDPFDSEDHIDLCFTTPVTGAASEIDVHWNSKATRTYDLEYCEDLTTGVWMPIAQAVAPDLSGTNALTVTIDPASERLFFRVQGNLPLSQ